MENVTNFTKSKLIEIEFTRLHMEISSIGAVHGFSREELFDLHTAMECCEKKVQEIAK